MNPEQTEVTLLVVKALRTCSIALWWTRGFPAALEPDHLVLACRLDTNVPRRVRGADMECLPKAAELWSVHLIPVRTPGSGTLYKSMEHARFRVREATLESAIILTAKNANSTCCAM